MSGELRRGTGVVLATLCAAACALLTAPAPASAAAPYPDAIVLVSGYNSSSAFTTPDASCEGKEGDTWDHPTGPAAALRTAGLDVFTAPVRHAQDPIVLPCAPGGQPTPDGSMYIDSYGDDDANGQALGKFLAFLQSSYGVERVQLVAHSDGGNWSRSALTGADAFPGLDVRSLTTLGTPYTGSMVADLGTDLKNGKCDFSDEEEQAICDVLLDLAGAVYAQLGPTAIAQLTHSYLEGWNLQQRIGSCPVTTIAGTGVSLPLVPFSFYNPSDALVGLASAHAQEAVSLPSFLPIPPPAIPGLVSGGDFPVVHSEALSFINPANLLNTTAISSEVAGIVSTTPSGPLCNPPADPGPIGRQASVHRAAFRAIDPATGQGVLGKPRRGDVVVARDGVEVTCGGTPVPLTPVLESRELRAAYVAGCKESLRAAGPGSGAGAATQAMLLESHPGRRLTVRRNGRKIKVGVNRGPLRKLRLRLREGGDRAKRLRVTRRGRAKLPFGSRPVTVIARTNVGRGDAVATASIVLSR